MPDKPDGDINRLLSGFRNGEPDAEARLMEAASQQRSTRRPYDRRKKKPEDSLAFRVKY
jgi:hypothetical protein